MDALIAQQKYYLKEHFKVDLLTPKTSLTVHWTRTVHGFLLSLNTFCIEARNVIVQISIFKFWNSTCWPILTFQSFKIKSREKESILTFLNFIIHTLLRIYLETLSFYLSFVDCICVSVTSNISSSNVCRNQYTKNLMIFCLFIMVVILFGIY